MPKAITVTSASSSQRANGASDAPDRLIACPKSSDTAQASTLKRSAERNLTRLRALMIFS